MSSYSLKSPRCGRCAEPIPEDTSSYCKLCGIPFFKVPPTTDFHLIAEEHYRRSVRARRLVTSLFTFLLVFAAASLLFLGLRQHQHNVIAEMHDFPKVRFFYYDFPEFPSLSRNEKTEATYVAVQAFEDHFGLKIDDYEIHHDEVPEQLNFLSTGYFSDLSTFNFWDERVFEKNVSSWIAQDRKYLDVLISNFPIYLGDSQKIESRHLSSEKLISGLGHPSLVIATSYRLLNKLGVQSPAEKARHLGEYVVAHELGHGLLGIPDYVIKSDSVFLRGPASVKTSPFLTEHCLMHTDEGGGALAWESIKQRKMGTPSSCGAYSGIINANHLREQAIELAKAGKMSEATSTMTLALAELTENKAFEKSWVRAIWEKELNQMRPTLW